MEKITIVGIRNVDFTDQSGKAIKGLSLFYTMEDDNTMGVMTGKMFLSDKKISSLDYIPKAGDVVYVNYDRYGRPSAFQQVSK